MSSQCPRTAYVWNRAVDDATPIPSVKLGERPSLPVLRTLLQMNKDHPAINQNVARLEAYINLIRLQHGNLEVVYEQKDMSQYAGDDYRGAKTFGRFYPPGTATFLPKPVVSTLFGETHVELDIQASYPTMLASCFRDVEIPTITNYATSSLLVLNDFSRQHGIGTHDMKHAIISTICSFPNIANDFGLGHDVPEKVRVLRESRFMRGFISDLQKIAVHMERHYGPFLKMVERKCRADPDPSKREHIIGCALAYLCGDAESMVMRCAMGFLEDQDETNDVLNNCIWKFDGMLVPKDKMDLVCVSDIERRVLEKTGIRVKFGMKQLQGAIALAIPPDELRNLDKYETWKAQFEKTYFVCQRPAMYCRVWEDGVQDLTKADFELLTQTEDKEMLKLWKADQERREYLGRDFAPPPLEIRYGYFNEWTGLFGDKLPHNEEPVDITLYMDHVALLMGGDVPSNQPAIEYVHKLIAYKFQNPGAIWRVMVFIRSVQGVGKDTWLDFLFGIMGHRHGRRLSKVAEIAGQYNSHLEGALMVGFSELDARDCNDNMESLKEIITSNRVTIKKKYVSSYDINNMACFIGFSNNYNAIKMTADDRRIFAVTADGTYANNPTYHVPLLEFFAKPEAKRAVYDYYMNLDVEGFDPSGDRPVTETMQSVTLDSLSIGDVFLKTRFAYWLQEAVSSGQYATKKLRDGDRVLQVQTRGMYDEFQLLAVDMKFNSTDSKRKMDLLAKRVLEEAAGRIQPFFIDKAGMSSPIEMTRGKGGVKSYKFHIGAIVAYINAKLGGPDGIEGEAVDFGRFADQPMDIEPIQQSVCVNVPRFHDVLSRKCLPDNFSDMHEYENEKGAYAEGFIP